MLKKAIIAAAGLVLAFAVLTSCVDTRNATSGTVNYFLGASLLDITEEDMEAWGIIENAYKAELMAIPGILTEGNFFMMEGKYSECDEKVVNACKNAESKIADVVVKGHLKMSVRAVYLNVKNDSIVYQKEFGTSSDN